ncbi:MAG: GNAT family N-acetyltransferase [Flavobacteriaceae bacterium]|nr:GNAT family N-acetyltransferase [Flavobacteriaceae bacterium]
MIKGEKVVLRPLKKEDWKKSLIWRNDLELTSLVMSHAFPITENLEIEWYDNLLREKSNEKIYFAIDELNGNFIGIVYLTEINWIHGTCKFHILIGEKVDQGKGYGKEVLSLIQKYVFDILNLRKIILEVIETNTRAINLYKNFGFRVEGTLEKQFYFNKVFHSVLIMSLFKSI